MRIALALMLALGWERQMFEANRDLELGRYREAERGFRRALSEARRFGEEDLRVAAALNNLALACQHQGRLAEAEKHYRRSIAVWQADEGALRPLTNLAALYSRQRRFDEASQLLQDVLATATGQVRLTALNNLAVVQLETGRVMDARERLEEALKAWPEDPTQARPLANLAVVYSRLRLHGDAGRLMARAVELAPPGQQLRAEILGLYAEVLRQAKRKAEAKAVEREARALLANEPRYTVDITELAKQPLE